MEFDPAAVSPLCGDLAKGILDDAYGVLRGLGGLGVLARGQWSSQPVDDASFNQRAVFTHQVGQRGVGKIVLDQKFGAIFSAQDQISAVAGVIGLEDKIAERNF